MNNEQEIERMANIIHTCDREHCPKELRKYCDKTVGTTCKSCKEATALFKAGIGDKKQAVKEAFEKLKKKAKPAYFEDLSFPDEITGLTWGMVTEDDIDELFTELYGEKL